MKYSEIYKSVDDFLNRSLIKEYCSTICKGQCCTEYRCDQFPEGCKNKLACKVYLCGELVAMLNSVFDTNDFDFFLNKSVVQMMAPLVKSVATDQRDLYAGHYNTRGIDDYVFQKVQSLPIKEERVSKIQKLFKFFVSKKLSRFAIKSFSVVPLKILIKGP